MADALKTEKMPPRSAGSDSLVLPTAGRPIEMPDAPRHGVFGFNSLDRRSRPFNLLRSQVLKLAKARGWRLIGVTSPSPNVGKTFVASNLAASLSRIPGQRVMLVDLDLRRGSVAKQFALDVEAGLERFLSGEGGLEDDVVLDVQNSGLSIIPSIPTGQSSAEMLAGARMQSLVSALRRLDDQHLCIIDLPPAFANDDASIVLRQIDAYLLVAEEGKTTIRQMRDAIEVLKPAPCMGTVLNRYRSALGGDDYGFGYWSQRKYDAYYN